MLHVEQLQLSRDNSRHANLQQSVMLRCGYRQTIYTSITTKKITATITTHQKNHRHHHHQEHHTGKDRYNEVSFKKDPWSHFIDRSCEGICYIQFQMHQMYQRLVEFFTSAQIKIYIYIYVGKCQICSMFLHSMK
jgi:hypothetical protein